MSWLGYLVFGGRCLLAAVFAAAFIGKTRSVARFRLFAASIRNLALLPEHLATLSAGVIVLGEGATAALLAMPWTVRIGFATATCLLLVFVGVVLRAVRGGVLAECRCFGSAGSVMSTAMLARDLVLLAFAAPGLVFDGAVHGVHPGYLLGAALAGFAGALAVVRYYDGAVRLLVRRRSLARPRGSTS